ncbi:MAG TPA: class I SAM-dependent methyltransferase [Bacillota bacterium]|nr:class I SAM-dependent methyltransferase [Bacillota bacterium]
MKKFYWHNQVEKTWNEMAEGWSSRSKNMWENGSRKDIIPFMKRIIPSGNVIDIGCGDGYGTHLLKENGYDVLGVDLSEEMIALAREKKIHEDIPFQQGDICSLPFQDNAFDGALIVNVIEWTEQPLQALHELRRILKPGGVICIGILGPTAGPRRHSYHRLYGEKVICNMVMPWEWHQLCEENGFAYEDSMTVPKKGMKSEDVTRFPQELQQALSFMAVSIFRKKDDYS